MQDPWKVDMTNKNKSAKFEGTNLSRNRLFKIF